MKEKSFKVFATNGKHIGEVFFITRGSKGDVYLGHVAQGLNVKWSRHVSGEMHVKTKETNEIYQKIDRKQKLTEFRGIEHLLSHSIPKDAFERQVVGKVHKGKKFDGSAFIDIRNYNKLINIISFLLEPDQTHVLASLTKGPFKNSQIIIFSQIKPWIVLVIYEP